MPIPICALFITGRPAGRPPAKTRPDRARAPPGLVRADHARLMISLSWPILRLAGRRLSPGGASCSRDVGAWPRLHSATGSKQGSQLQNERSRAKVEDKNNNIVLPPPPGRVSAASCARAPPGGAGVAAALEKREKSVVVVIQMSCCCCCKILEQQSTRRRRSFVCVVSRPAVARWAPATNKRLAASVLILMFGQRLPPGQLSRAAPAPNCSQRRRRQRRSFAGHRQAH